MNDDPKDGFNTHCDHGLDGERVNVNDDSMKTWRVQVIKRVETRFT